MNRIIIEFSGDDFAARDIGAVNEDHGDVAEVVSYTLDKSSGLLFDKCRARLWFSWRSNIELDSFKDQPLDAPIWWQLHNLDQEFL